MIRNRNTIRLLCLLCLLVHPAINVNLEAQTIIGQRNDSVSHPLIRHQLGFDIQSLSFHFKYAFRFGKESNLGRLFPHTYQGIGVSYHTFFSPVELGNPVSVYAFQGSRIAQLSPRLSLDYEWNFGASFGWKKYDDQSAKRVGWLQDQCIHQSRLFAELASSQVLETGGRRRSHPFLQWKHALS